MRLLKKIAVVLCLCFTFIVKAQVDTSVLSKQYSVEQLREDLDFLEKRLTKFHPDPYHYISKDSLHLYVEEIKKQITKPLNEFQFRFLTRQIVAKTDITDRYFRLMFGYWIRTGFLCVIIC